MILNNRLLKRVHNPDEIEEIAAEVAASYTEMRNSGEQTARNLGISRQVYILCHYITVLHQQIEDLTRRVNDCDVIPK